MPDAPADAPASTSALPQAAAVGSSSSTLWRRKGKTPTTGERADPWWKVTYELENKGSVARDHLANERTYLAWLRTSLSLASIGIAITQLFRLNASAVSTDPNPTVQAAQALSASPDLAEIQALLVLYAQRIDELSSGNGQNDKYRHLGKPVGGTFIALALFFLILGSHRYFKVQGALMESPSKFPPSRRSVAFATFCVAAIVAASFGAILSTK